MVYRGPMGRTNIFLRDELIARARELTGLQAKREIVEQTLQQLIQAEERKGILRFRGSRIWKGDLKKMRGNRF